MSTIQLNKRNPKSEGHAVNHMKFMGNTGTNDAHVLKLKNITSPDVSKMPFQIYDPKAKSIVYFSTLERKNKYIERLAALPNSEPLNKGGRF